MIALRLELDDVSALQKAYDEHLKRGGCFVPGESSLATNDRCVLILVHPVDQRTMELPATTVWISADPPGVGVAVLDFSDETRTAISAFIASAEASEENPDAKEGGGPEPSQQARLRNLSVAAMLKLGRKSNDPSERAMLERIYGKHVWAALLSNPRLTIPEVMRMARMGTLPIPLLEQIADNRSWLASPQVRRILLSNPRITPKMIRNVLRVTPTAELRLAAKQTAFPPNVRAAVRKLLG